MPVSGGRGTVMAKLMDEQGAQSDGGEGIRFHARGGWVYLAPLSRRAALQLVVEGTDMEVSAQLCDGFVTRIHTIDSQCCEQDSQFHPGK